MAVDYYIGKDINLLKALLAKAQQQLNSGRVTDLSVGGGNGVRTRHDFHDKHDPELEILRIRYSLWLRAIADGSPDLIAEWPNPYKERITRTRPDYHGFSNS